MLQPPTPTAVEPLSLSETTQPPPAPSETLTVPAGQTVPLAGVTDTCTLIVAPDEPGDTDVPVIEVVVPTAVTGPAKAVPGVSKTPPATPPISIIPAAKPAVRRVAAPIRLCTQQTLPLADGSPTVCSHHINAFKPS